MAATELTYQSTKTYQHSAGFSCCFRQWRATSHCNQLHGYALKVELVFEAALDERNWVVDFGGLKGVKALLEGTFDHTVVIASDDPQKELFYAMQAAGIMKVVTLDAVGCEKFAEYIFTEIQERFPDLEGKIQSVQVWEHEANSAKVIRKPESSLHMDWLRSKQDMSPEEFRRQYQQEPILDEVPLDNNGKHF